MRIRIIFMQVKRHQAYNVVINRNICEAFKFIERSPMIDIYNVKSIRFPLDYKHRFLIHITLH